MKTVGKYAEGQLVVDGVTIVDLDKEFVANPLFYIWTEYPKNYLFDKDTRLKSLYEYYTDNQGNLYLLVDSYDNLTKEEIDKMLEDKDRFKYCRNVDAFVNGADSSEYKHWIDAIS
jgi:hypothetical protein